MPRRARRAKTDRLDVEKLLALLLRAVSGERSVWRIVRVPSEADEQRRQPHRELFTLKQDRTRVTNRMGSVLATGGVPLKVTAGHRRVERRQVMAVDVADEIGGAESKSVTELQHLPVYSLAAIAASDSAPLRSGNPSFWLRDLVDFFRQSYEV